MSPPIMREITAKPRQATWVDGAQEDWRKLDAICAKMVAASEIGDRLEYRRIRRRMFYAVHRAIRKAHYKGRILRALGDMTLKPASLRVKRLLKSHEVSRKEGDRYNCLLTADSLAHFFAEDRPDAEQAHIWIREATRLLTKFKDKDIKRNINRLREQLPHQRGRPWFKKTGSKF